MITIKKIKSLKPRVRVRKLGEIFHLAAVSSVDRAYLEEALSVLLGEELLSKKDREDIAYFYSLGGREDYDDIYYRTLTILGESVADWDIRDPSGDIAWSERTVFPHFLYLDHLRSPTTWAPSSALQRPSVSRGYTSLRDLLLRSMKGRGAQAAAPWTVSGGTSGS